MSEENQATPPAAPNNDAEVQALKESVQKLEAKNRELIGKMQKKELIEPDDYESLKEFKRQSEQKKLEDAGKYEESKQALSSSNISTGNQGTIYITGPLLLESLLKIMCIGFSNVTFFVLLFSEKVAMMSSPDCNLIILICFSIFELYVVKFISEFFVIIYFTPFYQMFNRIVCKFTYTKVIYNIE